MCPSPRPPPRWRCMLPEELSLGTWRTAPRILQLDDREQTRSPRRRAPAAREALSSLRAEVFEQLDARGAVLLRGWRVRSAAEFGEMVAALGLPDLPDYFPAEPGREPLAPHPSAATVWPTNSLRRTGGYLSHEILPHTENYYALQQPRLVVFWCERQSLLGGETLLVDGNLALTSLRRRLRARLQRLAFTVRRRLTCRRLRRRHQVEFGALLEACGASGVHARLLRDEEAREARGAADRGVAELAFQKPGVVAAAPLLSTRRRACPALCLNCSEFGAAPRAALLQTLLERGMFAGARWAMHRLLWRLALRWPLVAWALRKLDEAPGWLRHPRAMFDLMSDDSLIARCTPTGTGEGRSSGERGSWVRGRTLGETLTEAEQEELARALGASAVAFHWHRGDVLLLDNARILHDGLPGLGFRSLRVALVGECVLPQSRSRLWPGFFDEQQHSERISIAFRMPHANDATRGPEPVHRTTRPPKFTNDTLA
ncbi:hypothetical protein AB1Y20_015792 [Prymnesium parvum]|uniref:TauD/TfdA-like domain-containing protein n=1 Tax=Prymnesium parvum TaxID=97485 RepID=A0AB34K2H1_PRYPA